MRISEVSQQTEVTIDTLRYYERVGLLPPISRTESGIRDYDALDVKRIEFIKCLRRVGLPIEVLIEYFRLVQEGDQTVEARKGILLEQREKLIQNMSELQETLDLLDYKIGVYEQAILKFENAVILIDD